mmetsp:Transcript_29379/g.85434  ORF Transcript_29379/g.85434 Transcript_29379/m.85434 type:complete len:636 (-) Transcript_29379:275-2182(-)
MAFARFVVGGTAQYTHTPKGAFRPKTEVVVIHNSRPVDGTFHYSISLPDGNALPYDVPEDQLVVIPGGAPAAIDNNNNTSNVPIFAPNQAPAVPALSFGDAPAFGAAQQTFAAPVVPATATAHPPSATAFPNAQQEQGAFQFAQDCRSRLVAFYKVHDPTKSIDRIDRILANYKGNEVQLFCKVAAKYAAAGITSSSAFGITDGDIVLDIFKKHEPKLAKVAEVNTILAQHAGRTTELFRKLDATYPTFDPNEYGLCLHGATRIGVIQPSQPGVTSPTVVASSNVEGHLNGLPPPPADPFANTASPSDAPSTSGVPSTPGTPGWGRSGSGVCANATTGFGKTSGGGALGQGQQGGGLFDNVPSPAPAPAGNSPNTELRNLANNVAADLDTYVSTAPQLAQQKRFGSIGTYTTWLSPLMTGALRRAAEVIGFVDPNNGQQHQHQHQHQQHLQHDDMSADPSLMSARNTDVNSFCFRPVSVPPEEWEALGRVLSSISNEKINSVFDLVLVGPANKIPTNRQYEKIENGDVVKMLQLLSQMSFDQSAQYVLTMEHNHLVALRFPIITTESWYGKNDTEKRGNFYAFFKAMFFGGTDDTKKQRAVPRQFEEGSTLRAKYLEEARKKDAKEGGPKARVLM